jgi:hypothetical protein
MKRTIIGVFESGIWEKTAKVDEWGSFRHGSFPGGQARRKGQQIGRSHLRTRPQVW